MKTKLNLTTAIWLPFKLFFLPMAVYLGIYKNGKSYSHINNDIAWSFQEFMYDLNFFYMPEEMFMFFKTLLAIPSAIASVMPAGFFYVGYISVFTGEDILFFAIWLIFLVTARPQIPQFVLRKLRKGRTEV